MQNNRLEKIIYVSEQLYALCDAAISLNDVHLKLNNTKRHDDTSWYTLFCMSSREATSAVVFNRGSAEPKSSVSASQGFRRWASKTIEK